MWCCKDLLSGNLDDGQFNALEDKSTCFHNIIAYS